MGNAYSDLMAAPNLKTDDSGDDFPERFWNEVETNGMGS